MRDLWQTTNINNHARSGLATYPKVLKSSGIKRMVRYPYHMLCQKCSTLV